MHPQLDSERFHPCEDLIKALQECHRNEFMKQIFGLCNEPKTLLTKCLHDTRLAQEREKILERKEKTKKFELRRKQLEEEKYGKDGYLKKVIEKELELENNGKK
ncbi:BA75_01941T0 [Komagataella pastoris]|uniref:COX assembly mitochondrial protein n=1 Tax=Komagataella pastoris TaxID=4922 RepID=A0A1B2JC25_PICPA|nr:BA75_01941T0 [Komagataella pastoris]